MKDEEIVLLDIYHDPSNRVYFFTSNMVLFIFLVLLIPFISFLSLNKMLVMPIEEVIKDMKIMLDKGKMKPLNYRSKTTEFKNIIDNFNLLSEKVNSHKDELKKLTLLDELTQIPNKRAFNMELENVFDSENDNAIVMCDIDYFKKFNDNLGHLEGDIAIKLVAQQLLLNLKDNEKVFRYGGEEFALIINNTNYKELAKRLEVINRKILELELEHPASDISNFVTVSLGASIHNNNKSVDIIKKADEALYKSKEKGRNTYTII